ncbi:unnamed protein product [Auanema sp. JU1783]|nr:unnamed protein product [Auanema sp. JU1783]
MKLRSRRGLIFNLPNMGTCGSLAAKDEVLPPTQVRTNYGIIEGKRFITKSGFQSDCFLGIPYAAPPVGPRRFKKPEPPEAWDGVKKCKRFGPRSVQNDMFWDKFTCMVPQSEDCLYLNVFAPAIDTNKKYPVMFYIHGGGFMMDSAVRYTPRNVSRLLVSRGIVVVTIQYRLGYLGYFCTGDDASKGNYGLWDQYYALKWAKENIHYFGGDPDQITVAGQSAGGVSTDLLSMSPLSRDMFKRKIVMGGSSFCHWSVAKTEEISEFCKRKAQKLGWKPRKEGYKSSLEEHEHMMSYLRKLPASKFGTHLIGSREVFEDARLPLAPVVDGEILPARPAKLRLDAPKMDSICGVGEQESLLFIALGAMRCNGKDIDRVLQALSRRAHNLPRKEVEDTVREIYGDSILTRRMKKVRKEIFVNLLSDIISNYACYQYMKDSQSNDKNCYSYSFDYTSRRMWGWLATIIPFMAGTHSSELIYLFDCNYFSAPLPMNSTDQSVSNQTSSWFAEFVKHGNPNHPESDQKSVPHWDPIAKDGELEMFSISDKPHMKKKLFGDRMLKLDGILPSLTIYNNRSDRNTGR